MEVRGPLLGTKSVLSLCGFQGSKSDCQLEGGESGVKERREGVEGEDEKGKE